MIKAVANNLIMVYSLSAMVTMEPKITSLLRTHGVPLGVTMDTSKSLPLKTTFAVFSPNHHTPMLLNNEKFYSHIPHFKSRFEEFSSLILI
jgi:hypothetical protein